MTEITISEFAWYCLVGLDLIAVFVWVASWDDGLWGESKAAKTVRSVLFTAAVLLWITLAAVAPFVAMLVSKNPNLPMSDVFGTIGSMFGK